MGNIFHSSACLVQGLSQAAQKNQVAGPLEREAAHEGAIGGGGGGMELVHHGPDILLHTGVAGVLIGNSGGVGLFQQGGGILAEYHGGLGGGLHPHAGGAHLLQQGKAARLRGARQRN